MDGPTFDELTKALRSASTRRQATGGLLGLGLAALTGRSLTEAKGHRHAKHQRDASGPGGKGGNSNCAKFCAAVFGADTPAAGRCTSDAAQGTGLCHTCGASNAKQVCCVKQNGVCTDYAAAACCTGKDTCGGGNPGTPGVCGCTAATTCPNGQTCGTAGDGCGGAISCSGCAGCCDGNTCVAVKDQSDATCGTGGAACDACAECTTCTSGSCQQAGDGTPCGGANSGLSCCKGVCPSPPTCLPPDTCCDPATTCKNCCGFYNESDGLCPARGRCLSSYPGERCADASVCIQKERTTPICLCDACCYTNGSRCITYSDCCSGHCDYNTLTCVP